MSQIDLLAQQREAVRAFRRAEALSAEADMLLWEAHKQYEKGQALLRRVGLAHLLDEERPWVQPEALKADQMAELARGVKVAHQAVANLDRSVEALLKRREKWSWRSIITRLGCLGSLMFGFLGGLGGCTVGLFVGRGDEGVEAGGWWLGFIVGLILGISALIAWSEE